MEKALLSSYNRPEPGVLEMYDEVHANENVMWSQGQGKQLQGCECTQVFMGLS